jgi:hypothetical protein
MRFTSTWRSALVLVLWAGSATGGAAAQSARGFILGVSAGPAVQAGAGEGGLGPALQGYAGWRFTHAFGVRAEMWFAHFEPNHPLAGVVDDVPNWPLNVGGALVTVLIGSASGQKGPALGYLIAGVGAYSLARQGIDGSPTVGLNIGGGVELNRFKHSLYVDVRFHVVPNVVADGGPFVMAPFTLGVKF